MSFQPSRFWLPSSMVEQLTLNQLVRGSSPRGATSFFDNPFAGVAQWQSTCFVNRRLQVQLLSLAPALVSPGFGAAPRLDLPCEMRAPISISTAWWCNGSTNDSDSFCLGSSPSRAANFKRMFARFLKGTRRMGRYAPWVPHEDRPPPRLGPLFVQKKS